VASTQLTLYLCTSADAARAEGVLAAEVGTKGASFTTEPPSSFVLVDPWPPHSALAHSRRPPLLILKY
jgi:hypothetical protein